MAEEINNEGRELALDDLFSGLGGTILESIRTPFGIFDNNFRILWINKVMSNRLSAISAIELFTAVTRSARIVSWKRSEQWAAR